MAVQRPVCPPHAVVTDGSGVYRNKSQNTHSTRDEMRVTDAHKGPHCAVTTRGSKRHSSEDEVELLGSEIEEVRHVNRRSRKVQLSPDRRPSRIPWDEAEELARTSRRASRSPSPCGYPPSKRRARARSRNNDSSSDEKKRRSTSLTPTEIDDLADCIASRLNPSVLAPAATVPPVVDQVPVVAPAIISTPQAPQVQQVVTQNVPVLPAQIAPSQNGRQLPNAVRPNTAPVKEIQPEKFQLGQDWNVYINTFHELATYNQWDSITAAQRLKFSLAQPALERAHNVAKIPTRCSFGQLVGLLAPIFGSVYKEGKAATLFEQRCRQPDESYQDYMLNLFKLFNQAYPDENQVSKLKRISKRFILGIGDQELAQYLADQPYSGPMELVQLAERRQCLFMELNQANKQTGKVADSEEPEAFRVFPDGEKPTWNKNPQRLHPEDLKAIGESVSQSIGSKLTYHKQGYNKGKGRWQNGQSNQKQHANDKDKTNTAGKEQSQVKVAPSGNDKGLVTPPTISQSENQ